MTTQEVTKLTKEEIRERIMELNYYMILYIEEDDSILLDVIKIEINKLIEQYLKIKK